MIVAWDSTSTNTLNYALSNFTGESEILLIYEFRTASYAEAKQLDETAQKLIAETPEELLQFALPSLFEKGHYPIVSMLHKLPGTRFKLFETHSDVLSYYMEDFVDTYFAANKDFWINGFVKCLQSCLIKNKVNIIALPGRMFDPFVLYFQHLLMCLGVKQVQVRLVYERKIEGLERLTERLSPIIGNPLFRLNDPDALMLLLVHFASHPTARSGMPHRHLNVAQVATKLLSSELYKFLPPKRGNSRSYDGLYKALKKISEAMVSNGLLETSSDKRHDDYRLTSLGQAYAKIALLSKEFFDGPSRIILDNMKSIQEQGW
jgi:hypothetical protein